MKGAAMCECGCDCGCDTLSARMSAWAEIFSEVRRTKHAGLREEGIAMLQRMREMAFRRDESPVACIHGE